MTIQLPFDFLTRYLNIAYNIVYHTLTFSHSQYQYYILSYMAFYQTHTSFRW
jgi:hypothetical protein